MIVENHALWGEEPTEDYPATFTYLGAEPLPDKPNGRRPAVIICGGGGFTHIAPHELWCLALCTLSNLVVFGIYLAGSAFSSQGLTAAGTLTMLLCALANTVTAAWMIPAGLFLTARLGMLAGIFCPLATQLVGGFAWSLMPLPQLFPPSASMVIPTSFIPVLPSGEPLAADMALGGALAADGMLTLAGLAVCALAFAALTAAGAAWFARSEER